MQVEDIEGGILRSSNWARENQDREKESKRCIGL